MSVQIDRFAANMQKLLVAMNSGRIETSVDKIDKSDDVTPLQFAKSLAAHHYLRKYEGSCDLKLQTPLAVDKYLLIEDKLKQLNACDLVDSPGSGAEGIFFYAKRKILSILGPSPNLNEFAESCDWGPGATSTLKGKDARLDKKILEPKLSVTYRALRYASAFLKYDPAWFHARDPKPGLLDHFSVVDSSRFTTVLKDMRGCRPIDIQPTFNLFLQKGVGRMIRKRLRREGIDLDDQSRNQQLAARAFNSALSTLDLANASDTLVLALVRLLLPPKWYELLYDLRVDFTILPGNIKHRLQKFSAMGNGYTFELESLIFYALCWAVVRDVDQDAEGVIAIYGDDIIVPRNSAVSVVNALAFSGFTVNLEKSYIDGNYFESCGAHYFKGCEVTPPFQKEVVSDLRSAVRYSNRLSRWLLRLHSSGIGIDELVPLVRKSHSTAYSFLADANEKLATSWKRKHFTIRKGSKSRRFIPMRMPVGPLGIEGDDYLISDTFPGFDENGVYYGPRFSVEAVKCSADDRALFAQSLRKGVVVENPFNGLVPLRGRTRQRYMPKAKLWASTIRSHYDIKLT